jgi:solute carrier family 13 (sodium-dependent dicarboxylate transporter), member 2/3/5
MPESSHALPRARSAISADRIGFVLGPLALIAWFLFTTPGALRPEAHRLAGILLLTFIWWVTEPIPIAATGLLAVVLCVVLGVASDSGRDATRAVLAPFADPSVFFLLGGLFIGRAMMRHGLDRRLALSLLCTRWAGRSPATLLATVGLCVTLISMWISNTAAAAMMCPVTVGIIAVLATHNAGFAHSRFATALLLITAFGASVGGIATPIGTATNVVALGYLRRPDVLGRSVDFLSWCAVGIPMMAIIFVGMFLWLRLLSPADRLNMPALREYLRSEYEKLGPWKRGEVNTLVVFLIVVALWIAPGVMAIAGMSESQRAFNRVLPEEIIALLAPVLLFLIPVDFRGRSFTLESADFQKIDWGTILMYGAALSLGVLMFRTGLAEVVGRGIFNWLGTNDLWVLTAVAIAAGILLSEVTSNTATASALLPVIHQLCVGAGVDPLFPLLGVTFAASFGSSLPVSTPPNAIVYSTGFVPVRRMIVGGLGVDIVAGIVIWSVLRIAWEIFEWSPLAIT